jgi:hypothetical protein
MTAKSKAERFLEHVLELRGGIEPKMYVTDSTHDGQPPVTAMVWI